MMTDPIADLLTRIRNAGRCCQEWVEAPWSKLKERVARVLLDEGYLQDVIVRDADAKKQLRVYLKYDSDRRPVITGLQRVSRPSMRVYVGSRKIPTVRRGLGVNVLSTSKGILPDRVARKERVGGEILFTVW